MLHNMPQLAMDTINGLPFFFEWENVLSHGRCSKNLLQKGSCYPSFVGGYSQMWSQTNWHKHLRESNKLETEG